MVPLLLFLQGDFEAGKYRCLICGKEFNSESGVKYHINSVHSQVRTAVLLFFSRFYTHTQLCLHHVGLTALPCCRFNRNGL